MHNKKIIFSLISLLLVFSACSSSAPDDLENAVNGDNFLFNGFEQPERVAEISGVIKSITGNLMTVAIVEKQAGENATETKTENNSVAIGVTPTTNMPGSGAGRGGTGRDSSVSDADRLEKLLERSTGQEAITVPVGIAMTKFSESEDREKVEAILSDLKVGLMVSVWLNQEITDKKVAEFVGIR